MTTAVTTRGAGTLNPTRQQLDELDALLRRMLELPVHPLDKPEQTKSDEPDEEPSPPAAILSDRPASVSRSSFHQPADAGRSPIQSFHQPTDAVRSPVQSFHQPADAVRSPVQPATRPTVSPISYTIVETATPRPLPPASGFELRPPMRMPRPAPVAPPPPQTPSVAPAEAAAEGEAWVPLRSTWQPSASTWPPLAENWRLINNETPPFTASSPIAELPPEPPLPLPAEPASTIEMPVPLPSNETSVETLDPELRSPVEPLLSLSAEDAPVAVPWPLLPLVWFNQGFDACLAPLGVLGRWLCGRGRIVLGVIGLTCLTLAVALAVSTGMGWSW